MHFVGLTTIDVTAVSTTLMTIGAAVFGFWKWAASQQNEDRKAGAEMRTELRDENKILRAQNQEQYDQIRDLQHERDILEDHVREARQYIDRLQFEMQRLLLPAVFEKLPKPPEGLLLEDERVTERG
jgi:uncharacterized protein HemX